MRHPEAAYDGNLIDSLISTVKKIEAAPAHSIMPSEIEDFVEAERNGRDGRAA